MPPYAVRSPARRRSETLAYVFFHRPRGGVTPPQYARALVRFHSALARARPTGFRESAALWCGRAPWKEGRIRPIYLDWYVLDGFHALDPIRAVAYRPPWVRLHRAIARRSSDGWGSLYATAGPAQVPGRADRLRWFSSSPATKDWLRRSPPGGPAGGTLWRRQLALGPAPEFCWAASGPVPPALRHAVVAPQLQTLFHPSSHAGRGRAG
jgi:hypothetical protein